MLCYECRAGMTCVESRLWSLINAGPDFSGGASVPHHMVASYRLFQRIAILTALYNRHRFGHDPLVPEDVKADYLDFVLEQQEEAAHAYQPVLDASG